MSDGFKINQGYAERYNVWRRNEELQKLKARYGDVDDSSSSSESDDEDEQEFLEKFDKGWLKAYSALKSNDPSLYEKDVNFYEDDEDETSDTESSDEEAKKEERKKKAKKEKPMYIKDYERKVLLEKGGIINEDEEDEDQQSTDKGETLGYYQEQEKLRKSIVAATQSSDKSSNDDDEDDGLLVKRVKSKEDKDKEESDYLDWLKGQKEQQANKEDDPGLVPLKKFWNKPDIDDGEKFLRNYILNKEYMDQDSGMPSYDDNVEDDENLSEDEELLTLQDNFERKYNFRYEEPGAMEIQTFPREMEDSMRQKDNKRKDRREAVKERKEMEKDKKKEEIKQLKNLKKEEIMSKIEQLKKITGNSSLGFDVKDLEDDFDPKKHDEMMAQYFNDGYYDDGEGEEVKPEFNMSDDEDVINWDNWTGEGEGQEGETGEDGYHDNYDEPHADDPDFNMDADYDPTVPKKKRSRKKGKLAEALLKEKPVFDPGAKSFEEYFDEYYKLDYEDIVGDMPTRFRYRKVLANDFGLSMDEIIKARDKELNSWVSIKKMSQYRTDEEEQRDVKGFAAKGKNERKKKNILTSIFMSDDQREAQAEGEGPSKKNKKRKRKEKEERLANLNYGTESTNVDPFITPSTSGENKKGKKNINTSIKSETIVKEELDSGGKIPKKKGKKGKSGTDDQDLSQDSGLGAEVKTGKHKLEHSETESNTSKKIKLDTKTDITETVSDSSSKKKKKKKHKQVHAESMESLDDSVNESGDVNETIDNDKTESSDKVLDKKAKKRLRKKRRKEELREEAKKREMSDDRLKAYGINPKRYKYMSKQNLFNVQPRQHSKKASKINSE